MFFQKPNHDCKWLAGKWIFVADGFFGDNGKGKITNFVCAYLKEIGLKVGLCVRPNGGANAGHEVTNPFGRGDREGSYVGHITPMGILQGVPALIGPGAVLDLEHFFKTELPNLEAKGVDIENIRISRKTQIVLPHYKLLEEADEKARGASAVGTTKKAIGTAYEMRARRIGITAGDIVRNFKELQAKVELNIKLANFTIALSPPADSRKTMLHLLEYRDRLIWMVCSESALYEDIRQQGLVGVAEMGQGTGLDNIHGDYPFVTSSLTTIPGGLAQAGLSHKDLGYGILVVKGPYWTRVGGGNFCTEFLPDEAEEFRQIGHEFGTTTGRPRRCGYPNLPFLANAIRLNGPDCVCLTKLDAVPNLPYFKVRMRNGCNAIVDKWRPEDVLAKNSFEALPKGARSLVGFYENVAPVGLLSTGPSLEDIIINYDSFLRKP